MKYLPLLISILLGVMPFSWRAPSTPPPVWMIEYVDRDNYMLDHSLRLDSKGHPHIAYGENHLYYAWRDKWQWHYETVDELVGVGSYIVLALDGANRPHISYYDYGNGDLKYTWYNGVGWQTETVDNEWGRYVSLALDGAGRPHISYCSSYGLKYAWYDGVGWQIETADGVGSEYTSLALDSAGRPHISYYGDYDLKYAWYDGLVWRIETVDDQVWSGSGVSLALDVVGRPHISYYDGSDGIKYAWYDGTGWQIEVVDSYGGGTTSLALDTSTGQPHISYFADYDYTSGVMYARYNRTDWSITMVEREGHAPSLALDGLGRPHLSYLQRGYDDFYYADLKYAWFGSPAISLDKQATPSYGLHNNESLTYTLTLSGPGLSVRLWDPLPPSVYYVPGSITGTVTPAPVYSPTARAITWEGTLPTDTVQIVYFQVTPGITGTGSLALSPPIANVARLTDTESGASVSATAIVNARYVYLPFVVQFK